MPPFKEAVAIARSIHDQIDIIDPSLHAGSEYAVKLYGPLFRLVQKQLSIRHPDSSTSYTLKVHADSEDGACYGLSVINTRTCIATIVVMYKNTCSYRFALAKELMHHFTGLYIPSTQSAQEILSEARKSREITPDSPDFELPPEAFCLFAAIELMIPWKLRDKILNDIRSNKISHYELAIKLRIPEFIVDQFFASNYVYLSDAVNKARS